MALAAKVQAVACAFCTPLKRLTVLSHFCGHTQRLHYASIVAVHNFQQTQETGRLPNFTSLLLPSFVVTERSYRKRATK